MPEDKKKGTASNPTVEVQLAKLTSENKDLKAKVDKFEDENKLLKRQLHEANQVIERDLKTDLLMRIKSKSMFKDQDLEDKSVEQLQQIDATLSMGKAAEDGTYKNIRTGSASVGVRTSVGDLYGKSRKEILESDGGNA